MNRVEAISWVKKCEMNREGKEERKKNELTEQLHHREMNRTLRVCLRFTPNKNR